MTTLVFRCGDGRGGVTDIRIGLDADGLWALGEAADSARRGWHEERAIVATDVTFVQHPRPRPIGVEWGGPMSRGAMTGHVEAAPADVDPTDDAAVGFRLTASERFDEVIRAASRAAVVAGDTPSPVETP